MDYSRQILLEVFFRIVEIGACALEDCIGFPARSEAEHPLHFRGGEDTGSIGFGSKGLKRVMRQVAPLSLKLLEDVIGDAEHDFHGVSLHFRPGS
jgi:hypothetical protein